MSDGIAEIILEKILGQVKFGFHGGDFISLPIPKTFDYLGLYFRNLCKRKGNISPRVTVLPELWPQVLMCLLLGILSYTSIYREAGSQR